MARSLETSFETAISGSTATGTIADLVQMQFSGGSASLASTPFDIEFSGSVYKGLGGNFQVLGVDESPNVKSPGARLVLDGVEVTVMSLVLGQERIGRTVTIYRAYLDADLNIIDTPLQFGPFLMNSPFKITEQHTDKGGKTAKVETQLDTAISSIPATKSLKTNLGSHQGVGYTDDVFFKFTSEYAGKPITWGKGSLKPLGSEWTNDGEEF